MNEDILYTPEEIAAKLKLTKNTIYEMIKRGDLDAHRIGKHLRISQSQYETFLLKSKGAENVYEVTISLENGKTFAKVGETKIRVNTDLKGDVKIAIRPEDIILSQGKFISSARNIYQGTVINILEEANAAKVILDIGFPIIALITKEALLEFNIKQGSRLYVVFKTMAVKVFK